jgi:hypothetical protein
MVAEQLLIDGLNVNTHLMEFPNDPGQYVVALFRHSQGEIDSVREDRN